MNAKEKAFELLIKFEKVDRKILQEYLPSSFKRVAKECALICVEEIMNELVPADFKDKETYVQQKTYWQSVKTEIEKL